MLRFIINRSTHYRNRPIHIQFSISPEGLKTFRYWPIFKTLPVVVLLLGGVRLSKPPLEELEVMVLVVRFVLAADDLPDHQVAVVARLIGGGERDGYEERDSEEERETAIHVCRERERDGLGDLKLCMYL